MASRFLTAASLAAAALLSAGCGSQGVSVPKQDPNHAGAVLFVERCGACHTLSVAGTQGSADSVKDKENVDGPNFDTRVEKVPDVVYAIENGGFSGAIMPENIVTGAQKQQIATFLAKYAGSKVKSRTPAGGTGKGGTQGSASGGPATPASSTGH
jgi:mono/diheme cytochrome c family protein